MRTIPRLSALRPALTVCALLLCAGAGTAQAGLFFWRKKPAPPPTPRIIYTPAPAAQWPTPPPQGGVQPAAYRPPAPGYPAAPPAGQPVRPAPALPAWQPPAPPRPAMQPAVRPPVPQAPQPGPAVVPRPPAPRTDGGPAGQTDNLTLECLKLARQRLSYQFGSNDPARGGLDCSGAVQHVMSRMGLGAFPRTASDQYLHLEKAGTLTTPPAGASADWILQHCRRGDLLFWKGTYATGRWPDVSHVMIYLGIDRRDGKPKMFGASSRRTKGENGAAVDVYEFNPAKTGGGSGQFIGSASIPGVNVPAASWAAR